MIITLVGANFKDKNIGTLTTWSISRILGSGATYSGVTSVNRGSALSATVTIASGYELGDAGVSVTMGGVENSGAYSISGNKITISIPSVTGTVVIRVPTKNVNTGEEDSGDIESYTLQTLDSSKWRLAALSESGIGTDGTSTNRLSYGEVLDTPSSGRIKIICPEDYYIGIRSGASETSLSENQYWYRSGDEIQIAHATTTVGKFAICFAKIKSHTDVPTNAVATFTYDTITKNDVANIALYYKDEYSGVFDASNYSLIETLNTSSDSWSLAATTESGIGTDGSNTKRLSYHNIYDTSILQNNRVIMVTCDAAYSWALRAGSSETSLSSNIYWYNSGTCLILPTDLSKFVIIFKKKGSNTTADTIGEQTMTKADISNINAKLYTAKTLS